MKAHKPPKILSMEFHARFLPSFLWNRLRPKQRRVSSFSSPFELYITLAVCIILVAIGAPSALSHGSIAGWIAACIGLAGFLAMIIHSIASFWGKTPSYDDFLMGFFFFFITAGLTAGIFISTLEHYPFFQGLLVSAAGLVLGYALGIIAGFGLQYIGWLAAILNSIAYLAIIGMLLVDLVLLSGAFFS